MKRHNLTVFLLVAALMSAVSAAQQFEERWGQRRGWPGPGGGPGTSGGRFGPGFGPGRFQTPQVQTGFVILNGSYISPPYEFTSENGRLNVNGIAGPAVHLDVAERGQSRLFRGDDPNDRAVRTLAMNVGEDTLLFSVADDRYELLDGDSSMKLLGVLLSDDSPKARNRKLADIGPDWVLPEQWSALVEAFEAPDELTERFTELQRRRARTAEVLNSWAFAGVSVFSLLTLSGFLLTVAAFGVILSRRPPRVSDLRAVNATCYGCRRVVLLVSLFVLLNIYDLTCTLVVKDHGDFAEMNPFAAGFVDSTAATVAFKLLLTAVAATVLICLRKYRLSQLVSWWACLLYVVLTFRWSTYTSAFLG